GNTISFFLEGLRQETRYFVAVEAKTDDPISYSYSSIASATTSSDHLGPAAVNLSIEPLPGGTSIKLRWTAPGEDGTGSTGQSFEYRIYQQADAPIVEGSLPAPIGQPPAQSVGTPEEFQVGGLVPGTTYHFA